MVTESLHTKCRSKYYAGDSHISRFFVPDDKVPWAVAFDCYKPVQYTAPHGLTAPWADPDILSTKEKLRFNQIDGKVDRTSFEGPYQLDVNGLPLNPCGRTGIIGRGLLGRWGPNHAADPIVTRWKLDDNGGKVLEPNSGKHILQFVAIKRRDTGEWAIPGGMVDPGEKVSATLIREFSEEAMGSLDAGEGNVEQIRSEVNKAFQEGREVYRGYVDDPRNTDNAWMETVAVNFHDDTGTGLAMFKLTAGDDAAAVRWVDVDPNIQLYASHRHFIGLTAKLHNASWDDLDRGTH
ncbi:unnamed protein product [Mesocestoides corti]|nr:unnamed protein product [Mesocestoides corti]